MKNSWHIGFGVIILSFFSCQKDPAIEIDSNFIGNWKHHTNANEMIYLQMKEDSKGYIEYYENGSFKSDTQPRKWLIKNNKLYFGWLAAKNEKFSIDLYPSIASNMIINQHDTIYNGETYIILDGKYFKK